MSAAAAAPIQLQPALQNLPPTLRPGPSRTVDHAAAVQQHPHEHLAALPSSPASAPAPTDGLRPGDVASQLALYAPPSDDMSDPPSQTTEEPGMDSSRIPVRYTLMAPSSATVLQADAEEREDEGMDDEEEEEEDGYYSSSSSSVPDPDIQFDRVYALHNFFATVQGQATVYRGYPLVLLDDSNSYWWLVRVLQTQEVGYIPAENIEGPFERLARLNRHRNVAVALATEADTVQVERKVHSSYLVKMRSKSQLHPASGKPSALSQRRDGQRQDEAAVEDISEDDKPLVFFGPSTVQEFSDLEEWSGSSDASEYELGTPAHGHAEGEPAPAGDQECVVDAHSPSCISSDCSDSSSAAPTLGLHSQACMSRPDLVYDSQDSPRSRSQEDYYAAHEAYYAAQLELQGEEDVMWVQQTAVANHGEAGGTPLVRGISPDALGTTSRSSSASPDALRKASIDVPSLDSLQSLSSLSGDECVIHGLPSAAAPLALSSPAATIPSLKLTQPHPLDSCPPDSATSNTFLPSRAAPPRPGSLQVPPGATAGFTLHVIRIFAQAELNTSAAYKTVLLTDATTAREIVLQAAQRFGLAPARSLEQENRRGAGAGYALKVHALDGDERTLGPDECPLKVYEELTEKQAPSVRWSSLDWSGAAAGLRTSSDPNVRASSEPSWRTSRDFSDDHAVKFFLAPAPKRHDRQPVAAALHGSSSEVTLAPEPNQAPAAPSSAATLRFSVRVVLFADELAPPLTLDASGMVAVRPQIGTSQSAADSNWVYSEAVLSLPRSTTVAELVEMTLEYFGIPNGVSEGGEEAGDPQSSRETAAEQGSVTYGLTVNVNQTAEKALRPTSCVYDVFPDPPLMLALSPPSSPAAPPSDTGKRQSLGSSLRPSDPIFLIRRAETIRRLYSNLAVAVSTSTRARSPTERILASRREAKRRSQLASIHDLAVSISSPATNDLASEEGVVASWQDVLDQLQTSDPSEDQPMPGDEQLVQVQPQSQPPEPHLQAPVNKPKSRPAREASAALALKNSVAPRTGPMTFEPLMEPTPNTPISPTTPKSELSLLSGYGDDPDERADGQAEETDDTMEEMDDEDVLSPLFLLGHYSPNEDELESQSIPGVLAGSARPEPAKDAASERRNSLLEQLFSPSAAPAAVLSASGAPQSNRRLLSSIETGLPSSGSSLGVAAAPERKPGSCADRSSGSTDTVLTASEPSDADLGAGTISTALRAPAASGPGAVGSGGGASTSRGALTPIRTESLRRAYVVRVNQGSSLASPVSFTNAEGGAGASPTAPGSPAIGSTPVHARPRAASTSSATMVHVARPSSSGTSPNLNRSPRPSPVIRSSTTSTGRLPRSQSLSSIGAAVVARPARSIQRSAPDGPPLTMAAAEPGMAFAGTVERPAVEPSVTRPGTGGLQLAQHDLDLLFSITDNAYFSCTSRSHWPPGVLKSSATMTSGPSDLMMARGTDSKRICDAIFSAGTEPWPSQPQPVAQSLSPHGQDSSLGRRDSSTTSHTPSLGRYAHVGLQLTHVAHSLDTLLADALRLPTS